MWLTVSLNNRLNSDIKLLTIGFHADRILKFLNEEKQQTKKS